MQEWEKEREKQRELTRLLTIEEKRIYVALLERAAARQEAQRQGNKEEIDIPRLQRPLR